MGMTTNLYILLAIYSSLPLSRLCSVVVIRYKLDIEMKTFLTLHTTSVHSLLECAVYNSRSSAATLYLAGMTCSAVVPPDQDWNTVTDHVLPEGRIWRKLKGGARHDTCKRPKWGKECKHYLEARGSPFTTITPCIEENCDFFALKLEPLYVTTMMDHAFRSTLYFLAEGIYVELPCQEAREIRDVRINFENPQGHIHILQQGKHDDYIRYRRFRMKRSDLRQNKNVSIQFDALWTRVRLHRGYFHAFVVHYQSGDIALLGEHGLSYLRGKQLVNVSHFSGATGNFVQAGNTRLVFWIRRTESKTFLHSALLFESTVREEDLGTSVKSIAVTTNGRYVFMCTPLLEVKIDGKQRRRVGGKIYCTDVTMLGDCAVIRTPQNEFQMLRLSLSPWGVDMNFIKRRVFEPPELPNTIVN